MITHQVRPNGQHRVLASDGRWRRTHHHVSPRRNLHRPGDRVIDQRPGGFGRAVLGMTRGITAAANAMLLGMTPAIKRAIGAMQEFEKAQSRAAALVRQRED